LTRQEWNLQDADFFVPVLPENVAPEAIRLSSRIDEAEKACSSIANLIANSQTAPLRLYVIVREVDDIAHILQVFRSQFMNEDRLGDLLWASNVEGIENVLDKCMSDFEDIKSRMEGIPGVLTSVDDGNTSESDAFSEHNIAALRDELNAYKVKFSLVIALVNMYFPYLKTVWPTVDSYYLLGWSPEMLRRCRNRHSMTSTASLSGSSMPSGTKKEGKSQQSLIQI
jgi:hypothetical protein